MPFIDSRSGTVTALIASVTILFASCGSEPIVAPSSGPSAPPAETTTTNSSTIISPAFAYNYLYGQSPDPSGSGPWDADFSQFLDDMGTLVKDAKSIAGFVSGIVGGVNAGITILQFLGFLSKPPDEVALLTTEVNAIGTGITWQNVQTYVDQNYAPLTVAIDYVLDDGPNYVADGKPDNVESSNGLGALELDAAWQRAAIGTSNDAATDHSLPLKLFSSLSSLPLATSISWKGVIKPPSIGTMNMVFDWRLGAPFFLKAIALRLVVMNAIDPNFRTDHSFDAELSMIRAALVSRYQTMLAGVQCGSADYNYYWVGVSPGRACAIVCADIYTGISAISTITPSNANDYTTATCEQNQNTVAFADAMNKTSANVRTKLPLHEMQAMIDLLYTFLNPAPDLAVAANRISPQSQRALCLGTASQSPTAGANLQLNPCSASDRSQSWVYNRTTGQITNPLLGLCVGERRSTTANTNLGAVTCSTPHSDPDNPQGPANQIDELAQRWTWDPSSGQLRNAYGVAMAWFINPLSPGPAISGSSVVTEVVGQGGGFDTPPLDASSTTNNMTWSDTVIYDPLKPSDPGHQCNVGGSWMHCCPTGYAMVGALPNQNIFKCAPLTNATGAITLDTGTQRNGMHSCPPGQVMVGLRVDQNLLACQALPANSITGERVDTSTQDVYPMHACDAGYPTSAMSGIRVDQNRLSCVTTSLVQ